MPSSYTTSLRLTLPATGELTGTWGTTVNTGITELLDAAVAGTTTISSWGGAGVAYTLSNTDGAADEARKMFIVATGAPGEAKNVICPAVSKLYFFRNDTTGGFALTLKTSGGSGIAVPAGQYKVLYCDGTNVVEAFNSLGSLTLGTALAASSGGTGQSSYTTGDLIYAAGAAALSKLGIGTNGQILTSTGTAPQWSTLSGVAVTTFSAGTTGFTPSTATSGAVTLAGTLATTNGGTGLTSFTANRVFYASSTSAVGQSANLTFDGTTLTAAGFSGPLNGTVGASSPNTGAFTTLAASGAVTLSGGTANGVLYLDGSKVATSGSGLTYNGSTLLDITGSTRTSGTLTASYSPSYDQTYISQNGAAGAGCVMATVNYASSAYQPITYDASYYAWRPNGSEGMRLTSTGLGIGTSSPSAKVHANAPGGVAFIASDVAFTASQVNIGVGVLTAGRPFIGTNTSSNPLEIGTRAAIETIFVTGGTEQMRLDASGNLGIGTSSPGYKLDVSVGTNTIAQQWQGAGTSFTLRLKSGNGATPSSSVYRLYMDYLNGTTTNGYVDFYRGPAGNDGYLVFGTAGSDRMTLDSSGNLGIGTSSPDTKLTVTVADAATSTRFKAATGIVRFRPYVDATSGAVIDSTNAAENAYAPMTLQASTLRLFGNGGTGAVVDSSGNLGIGTSSPAYKLHVAGTSPDIVANNTGANGTRVAITASNTAAYISTTYSGTGIPLVFTTDGIGAAGNEKMRLDSSGNLGIGVTPSAWSIRGLQVSSSSVANDGNDTYLTANGYFDGSWKYINSDFAAQYYQVNGVHAWRTAPSGTAGNAISFTQAMTLDASGNLGVGTTSPSTRLHVVGGSTTEVRVVSSGDLTAGGVSILRLGGSNSATSGYLGYGGTTSTIDLWNTLNGAITFGTNNTERARITSGGDLLVGTTTNTGFGGHVLSKSIQDGNALAVINSAATNPYGPAFVFSAAAPNDATRYFLICSDTANTRATILSNGGIANYQANDVNLSDRREKTNFAPAKSYLDTICAIPVQTFNYIDQSDDDPGLTLGVVAQDVQAVAPELVMESNWGTKDDPKMRLSIYQTDLQYALMKCIQEQQELIKDLRARVAALETN